MTNVWKFVYIYLILSCYVFGAKTKFPVRQVCQGALGMENGVIPDGQISASSEWDNQLNYLHSPHQGRLNFKVTSSKAGSWSAKTNDMNQWLQVYLGEQLTKITGVATQGRNGHNQWVKKYKLQYSYNGVNFQFYSKHEQDANKEFSGNTDRDTIVHHELNPPIMARYIRFRPTAWYGHISMRVELYGCKVGQVCQGALGMENGVIPDGQISASSEWDNQLNYLHSPHQGRLNFKVTSSKAGSWSAKTNDMNQWLQVYLGEQLTKIIGVATQGRNGHNQWVKKYKLQYSYDGVNFQFYSEHDQDANKEFSGNTDRDTIVHHELNPPIRARYIRFRPTAWYGHISMRVELYGCKALGCPAGWYGFKSSCYLFRVSSPAVPALNWENARGECLINGGDLVSVAEKEEMDFINSKSSKDGHYWIGLNDLEDENTFVWTDGTLYNASVFNNWGSGEPTDSNMNEDCVELTNATWNDDVCQTNHSYICKRPKAICPSNWIQIQDFCYWFSSKNASWREAKFSCEERGSKLAMVNSQAKQQALAPNVKHTIWIGLRRDPKNVTTWLWVDGSRPTFTNWNKREPSDSIDGGHCGVMTQSANYTWKDLNCASVIHRYVCERAAPPPPSTAGYYTIGCYMDNLNRAIQTLEKKDIILDKNYQNRKNAIAKCAVAAMKAGYSMFAVQNGGWCAASATAPQTYNKYGKSMVCLADGEGGPWSNQVYHIREYSLDCFASLVGVSDPNIIPDSHLTASSTDPTYGCQPAYGRLGDSRGKGWCSKTNNSNDEWLQINLEDMYTVCRVDTQGDSVAWTTVFKLSYSRDGNNWTIYRNDLGAEMEFHRQGNATTINQHRLSAPVLARYIRFHPTDHYNHSVLRVEVYGTKAYHFNVSLTMPNTTLKLDLLNSTTPQYHELETAVMDEFNNILKGSYGFLLAELQRFGAQKVMLDEPKYQLRAMAVIKVFCKNWAVKVQLLKRIESSIKSIPMFDSTSLDVVDTALGCPAGWYGFKSSCYLFRVSSPAVPALNWENARGECLINGGDLVSVADKEEMDFINSKSSKDGPYWIGLNDLEDENTFVWTDGTPYNAFVFNNWGSGEPTDSNMNEDCVELTNAAWNDDVCQKNHSYICKRPKAICPPNWIQIQDFCYWFSSNNASWSEAKFSCEERGSKLAMVNSQAKQQALAPKVKHTIWIGLRRDPKNITTWMWVDGSRPIFTNWNEREPSDSIDGGHCRVMTPSANYTWKDLNCTSVIHRYVCERAAPPPPSTAGYYTIGCYMDYLDNENQTLEKKDAILDGSYKNRTNAIAKCAVAAMKAGYSMFALKNGGICAASATAPQTQKSMICLPDGKGGEWAKQVYHIKEYSLDCFANPVGVSNPNIIPDNYLTASSTNRTYGCQPAYGRLGDTRGRGWCLKTNNSDDEWLQIYLEDMYTVCRVDTQGDGVAWTTVFKLSYSRDGNNWTIYKNDLGAEMEFHRQGNATTINQHRLSTPVLARYIRFHSIDHHNHDVLRVEVYGTKAYHFNVWLMMPNKKLKLDLLNSTTPQYHKLETEVMNKFNNILKGSYGFLHAELQRFGAPKVMLDGPKCQLPAMAVIKVLCKNWAVKVQLLKRIESSIKSIPMFDSTSLDVVDTGNSICPPAIVNLNLRKTLEEAEVVFTTDLIKFTAKVNHSICSSSADSYWLITRAIMKTRTFCSPIQRALNTSTPVFEMWRKSHPDSYFYVSYILKNPLNGRVIGYDYGYISLLQLILPNATIYGVSFATKGDGIITLNASLSYYPQQASPLRFTWLCRRSSETFPISPSIGDSPNANSNATGGCYGYGPGKLSSTTKVLVVNVNKMEEGQTYVFEFVFEDSVISSKAVHLLTIHPRTTTFLINCIYNCDAKVVPSMRMIIESNCNGDLCKNITRYHWSLFKLRSANSWAEVLDFDKRILTDLNNPNVVITGKLDKNEYSLELNTSYKINSSISVQGGNKIPSQNEITFETVPPLSVPEKRCSVKPGEGVAAETNFTVNCASWQDENVGVTYEFSYITENGLVIFQSAIQTPYTSTRLTQGKESEDFNITIKVIISDDVGARAVDILIVKVKPLKNQANMAKEIEELVGKGDVREAASLAIASLGSSDNEYKDAILSSMSKVPKISQLSEVTQLTTIVVMATEDRDTIPFATLEDATSLLQSTITFLGKNASNYRDMIHDEIGDSTLNGLSNVLHASAKADNTLPKAKNLTDGILSLVDTLATVLLSIQMSGQRQSTYKSGTISMTLERQAPDKLGKKKLFVGSENETRVTFPSTKVLFSSSGKDLQSVDSQFIIFKENPYVWTHDSKSIKSSVLSLDLKGMNGSRLHMSNLTEPVELFIPIKEPKDPEPQDHFFLKPYNDSSAIRYHKIEFKSDLDTALVEIRPQNNTYLDVFVGAGVKPKPDYNIFRARIPDVSSCTNVKPGISFLNCTRNPFMFTLSSNITGYVKDYFIGIRLANDTNKRRKRGRVLRSCMHNHGRQKRSCVGVKDPPTTPPPTKRIVPQYDKRTDTNYTMSVKMGTCLYWSEDKQDWTRKGCQVGQEDVKGNLQCLCTHLSAFGGNIFVAPNPIDFDVVRKRLEQADPESFVVLFTVCSIFGIYFIGLVFARRADKKDERKVVANVYLTTDLNMSDNTPKGQQLTILPRDTYVYDISIQTGMWKGFGTTSNVALVMTGDQGKSDVIPLTDPMARRKYFTRGSVNNFTLTLPSSLGNLTDIRIWHDNTGSNPAWFLQQVVITDQQTEKKWYFFANKWLALDKRSGSIELDIKAAKEDSLTLFKPLFYARTARSLGEGNLWISVFTRPPQSPFTRCQRLSCCLSFILTAMMTSAMFYNIGETATDTFKFGPLVMSWTQIKIGIQSSVIAVPANLLVIFIFKNTKQTSRKDFYNLEERNRQAKTPGFLPSFFLYIAWCLCLLIASTGAAITVSYSLYWGPDVANQWLTSSLVSLVQDVLINQPIKVVAFAALLSLLIKKPPAQDSVSGPSLFQSTKAKRFVSTPSKEDDFAKKKNTSSKEWSMHEAVQEVVSFLIFSIILTIVCYGDQQPARYQLTNSTSSIFANEFSKVDNKASLWNWVDTVLLPGLYNDTWYNGQSFEYKEGFISNKDNFLTGMPRLRQLRIKPKEKCPTNLMKIPIDNFFPGCLQTYSSHSEDRNPYYLPKWITLKNSSHNQSVNDICPEPWRYQTASQINTTSHEAVKETYDGGGYVADLGYNKETASKVIRELRAHNWVDELTAAVFIEFTLFNPSTSLFCNVRNIYERLPTGQAVTSVDVRALSLYPSPNPNFQSFYEVCQLLFLVIIVVFFIVEIIKWFRQKRYFHQLWNWVELLLLAVSLAAVVVSFFKGKYTSSYVNEIQTNPYKTFSSDFITRFMDVETFLLSLAIFIITLKLLRIVRFNSHICQMQGTLKSSARSLLSFSVVFAVVLVAFSQFGYLCFGTNLANFASFPDSLRLVLKMSVGKSIDNKELHQKFPVLAYVYGSFFLLAMVFILINVFMAILVMAYEDVRNETGDADNFADAELGSFMYNVFFKKIKNLAGRFARATKQLGKQLPHKLSAKSHSRNTKQTEMASLLVQAGEEENLDDVKVDSFLPARSVKIPLAEPESSDVEDTSDKEQDDLLADIKTSFIEVSAELKSLSTANATL